MTNGSNNYGVEYSRIAFAERIIGGHKNVLRWRRDRDIMFILDRERQNDTLRILCCDEYCVGMAFIISALADYDDINIIFTVGSWNSYTREATEFCIESKLGLFNTSEIFGALFNDKYWDYARKDDKGNKVYAFGRERTS